MYWWLDRKKEKWRSKGKRVRVLDDTHTHHWQQITRVIQRSTKVPKKSGPAGQSRAGGNRGKQHLCTRACSINRFGWRSFRSNCASQDNEWKKFEENLHQVIDVKLFKMVLNWMSLKLQSKKEKAFVTHRQCSCPSIDGCTLLIQPMHVCMHQNSML